eukprot:CAMPEP_0170310716 /NCGR_PEP_ID=MMETSP0116_2-20130129/55846_1 /TAXON_ID=400756 /ORGANISM="Durinskia baltica, Strain CSIRO CS-38" /LENGTH=390 /DNA_ID=CAMNT_0010562995 /DNA_START=105 /DNA_END=1278 /DNA_ORIENTATION=+
MCRLEATPRQGQSCSTCPRAASRGVGQITQEEIDEAAAAVMAEMKPWIPGNFSQVRKIQDAPMNKGRVDMMRSCEAQGEAVAVKRMPNRWVAESPSEFKERHPKASEKPWFDLAALRALNERACPFVCDLLGIFRDEESTYVVTSLATEGDLFGLCQSQYLPLPGPAREHVLRPILIQAIAAVSWLHSVGFSHGDLSLENFVLSSDGGGHRVRIIDFGLAAVSTTHTGKVSGKQVYLPPEVYLQPSYDTRAADAFAVGVLLLAAAGKEYPWTTAKPSKCRCFGHFIELGFAAFIAKRKAAGGRPFEAVLSPALAKLAEGLLRVEPEERSALSPSPTPSARKAEARSVWEFEWLHAAYEDRRSDAGACVREAPALEACAAQRPVPSFVCVS